MHSMGNRRVLILWFAFTLFLVTVWLVTGTFCLFRGTFGFPCPGCGMTRAGLSLAQGEWMLAYFYHPLVFLLPVAIIYAVFWRHYAKKAWRDGQLFWLILGVVVIGLYLFRMINRFPHTQPMTMNPEALLLRVHHVLT